MQDALISVILPVYNVERYLPKCMDSLFAQTYANLEFLLIDDGSGEACARLCDSYLQKDARVRVFHKPNGGLSDARNYGIARAQGQYIACVDPDDYVDADLMEYLVDLIRKYDAPMAIASHRVLLPNGRTQEFPRRPDCAMDARECLERMLYHDGVDTSAWAKLVRRELYAGVSYPKGKLFEDIGTTYALMLQCDKIAVGFEPKYTYVVRANSIVNGAFHPGKLDLLEMTDRMARDMTARFPSLARAAERRQVYARFSTLNQMLNVRGWDRERRAIINYIRAHRSDILKDARAPRRDKLAIGLLSIGYPVYCACWRAHQRRIAGRNP